MSDVYHPRSVLYFNDQHKDVAPAFQAVAQEVDQLHCGNVAIDSYVPDPEIGHPPRSLYVYPLFALLKADGESRRVWYINVHNLTTRYAASESHPPPCAVICIECAKAPGKLEEYKAADSHASVIGNFVLSSRLAQAP